MNVDIFKLVPEMEKQYEVIRGQREKSYNHQMRSELERLKTFKSLEQLSSWSPLEMASAGFYRTGLDSSIQCFCCGLVLCTMSHERSPLTTHQMQQPECNFIKGIAVGNIHKYDVRVQVPEGLPVERAAQYKEEASRLGSFKEWPFYAKTDPAVLANTGFFFTGIMDKVQCFSCNGSLANWEVDDDPWKEHSKWFPECEYLQSKKSKEEINQYKENYNHFIGALGKDFTLEIKNPVADTGDSGVSQNIFVDEEARLDSFKTWPQEAIVEPAALARAGFFYTGVGEVIRCFCCDGVVHKLSPGVDPWAEHAKLESNCKYFSSKAITSNGTEGVTSSCTQASTQEIKVKSSSKGLEEPQSPLADISTNQHGWLQAVETLKLYLRRTYNNIKFRKIFCFGTSIHVAIDLKQFYADVLFVSKNIKNQPVEQVTFPELLRNLDYITVVEGEAGSGKSALLRKIAILWASGCCPILDRFKLIFYLPLGNLREGRKGLVDAICEQLLGPEVSLSEKALQNMLHHLKNQVLFLLDGYGETDPVPEFTEELIQKNHLTKFCIVIAVRPHRIGSVRHFANAVLSITNFPLYSTIYMLKKLFSHNIFQVQNFFIVLATSETLQGILKTPLFTLALCAFWVQYPKGDILSATAIFKAYMLYNTLKYPKETESMDTETLSCAELALKGVFRPCFDFTEEDLLEARVDWDKALHLGLLSKFTAQRLHPVYRFFHPSFQEYLAAKRMSELIESDVQEDTEKGLYYLQQINTFLKVRGRYYFFLRYACHSSSKATSRIIQHLLNIFNSSGFLDSQSESSEYLTHHPELAFVEHVFISLLRFQSPAEFLHTVISFMLEFVIMAAYKSSSMPVCAPHILQFLRGKSLVLIAENFSREGGLLRFLREYPESFSLVSNLDFMLKGSKRSPRINFSPMEESLSNLGRPTVDPDYASAYQLLNVAVNKTEDDKDNICSFLRLTHRHLPKSLLSAFASGQNQYKTPLLNLRVYDMDKIEESDCSNLMVLFSVSEQIKLDLSGSEGFIRSIRPAIEPYKELFIGFNTYQAELSEEEQEVILSMTSLESIALTSSTNENLPGYLLSHLDMFKQLKELILVVHENQRVLDKIPDAFCSQENMEKLVINGVNLVQDSPRLAWFVQHFRNLTIFHLNCNAFPAFENLVSALTSCKKLREIVLKGFSLSDQDISALASSMSSFNTLQVLTLQGQSFTCKKSSEAFANALGSLKQLEKLTLGGSGITAAAKSIVSQFQHLHSLKVITWNFNLSDESLLEIGKAAKDGYLQTIQELELQANHDITDAGWRSFFLTLDNMADLRVLNLSRLYTHQLKPHPTTVRAFIQCVSKLPSLVTIIMYGWLLDAEDFNMFNAMKEQHLQAKCLHIVWQWLLPFQANIQE
ncbi:baculoviral IAP repeat-containing protein 1 [Latimeria chalumnae]|uniref:baculoviral IAP repeat-containing protein 1 n=1 Tax=Latimeria chalumnae TaxID=7897 RepID=UPI00313F33C9